MADSNEALKDLICGLSDDDHFVEEPIVLSGCGHCVCKTCLPNGQSAKCKCGAVIEKEISNFKVSVSTKRMIKLLLTQLFTEVENKFSSEINSLKSKYTKIQYDKL